MRDRSLELVRAGMTDDEIASLLTSEGHHSPNSTDKVLPITVQRICLAEGIKVTDQRTRWDHDPSLLSANDLATTLGIPVNWLYVQIGKKRLLVDRQPNGAYLFPNSPSVLDAVRNLRDHTITNVDLGSCQIHKERHSHE